MQENFVSYEHALALKELGFDKPCLGGFLIADNGQFNVFCMDTNHIAPICNTDDPNNWLCTPLKQQVFEWFRDTKKKIDYPEFDYDEQKWFCHSDYKKRNLYDTYLQAESACIDKLIEQISK